MLKKSSYDSWKSRMELYMENRANERIILNSVQNGPLVCPTVVEEDGTTRTKSKAYIILNKQTMEVEESLNVTFAKTPPSPKTPPLEDDELVEIEAIEVYRNKLDENDVVTRNKARLVAQGYNQKEGIDYDETYAPVARLDSIIILLAYACALDFKLYQMDVKSAFLNDFINEEVYVAQPSGFIDFAKPNYVKDLYGLK
uniref:Retrovirus-related Pol polyprotein from transposon TNT 1-94 n=1 Tax=Tanacetum cinerariifolium TaxID=118510 RepID=A0A6L2KYP3_TANCI|nr:retrovirus-related Pol polyprotein from transposon TNT 1-94 [Tanacetum cinerariifolium]